MPIEFKVKVQKVGNSLQIVLPKPVCQGLKIDVGDEMTLTVVDSEITVRKAEG